MVFVLIFYVFNHGIHLVRGYRENPLSILPIEASISCIDSFDPLG